MFGLYLNLKFGSASIFGCEGRIIFWLRGNLQDVLDISPKIALTIMTKFVKKNVYFLREGFNKKIKKNMEFSTKGEGSTPFP